ncbi:unnamed protein product [Gordionus sp. m RMFG-2023]
MHQIEIEERIFKFYYILNESLNDSFICAREEEISNYKLYFNYIILPILLFAGIVGNASALIILFTALMSCKSNSYYYWKCIAIFNVFICCLYWSRYSKQFPLYLYTFSVERKTWLLYDIYSMIIIKSLYNISTYCLCLIMIDRYLSLFKPFFYNNTYKNVKFLKHLPIIFFIVIMLASLFYDYQRILGTCNDEITGETLYFLRNFYNDYYWRVLWVNLIFYHIIPGMIILYLGLRISWKLARFYSNRNSLSIEIPEIVDLPERANASTNQSAEAQIHHTCVFTFGEYIPTSLTFILHFFCFMPETIFQICDLYFRMNDIPLNTYRNINDFVVFSTILYVVLIIYIYLFFDKNFRRSFLHINKTLRLKFRLKIYAVNE